MSQTMDVAGPCFPRQPEYEAPALTTGALAELVSAELVGPADLPLIGIESLDRAGDQHLTFIRTDGYGAMWERSRARAALISRGIKAPGHDPATRALLIVRNCDEALVQALLHFAPPEAELSPGRHPTAIIDGRAQVHPTVHVGPGCIIEAGSVIEEGCVLHPGVLIGADVRIGARTILHAGAVVKARCLIGADCVLHARAIVGSDGFGFIPAPKGHPRHPGAMRLPHIGIVEIHDRVELGAGTCVDRAKFGATVIGSDTKIDNLCQIGHGARIGRHCLICGLCGISGSVHIGDGVTLAGQVGICDGLTIGPGARIAAQSGVTVNVAPGARMFGTPAVPVLDAVRARYEARKAARRANQVPKDAH